MRRLSNLLCNQEGYSAVSTFLHEQLTCHPHGEAEECPCCAPNYIGIADELFSNLGVFQMEAKVDTTLSNFNYCYTGQAIYWWLPFAPCDARVTCTMRVRVWSDFTNSAIGGKGLHGIVFIHTDPGGSWPNELYIDFADINITVAPGEVVGFKLLDLNNTDFYDSGEQQFLLSFGVNQRVEGGVAMLCVTMLDVEDEGKLQTIGTWLIGGSDGPFLHYKMSEV